ncbi:hypothetical protein Hypma_009389 [Hypsizygus marmoreus]|uniref:Uncharacterized protein n=1 Tax=Hypsizygus marmoreus TaxID=39966 RepID=A0A369JRH2_HYPMA|nr:hypothetical protein Hypma_009389 [Hypsizygus marmoreus]
MVSSGADDDVKDRPNNSWPKSRIIKSMLGMRGGTSRAPFSVLLRHPTARHSHLHPKPRVPRMLQLLNPRSSKSGRVHRHLWRVAQSLPVCYENIPLDNELHILLNVYINLLLLHADTVRHCQAWIRLGCLENWPTFGFLRYGSGNLDGGVGFVGDSSSQYDRLEELRGIQHSLSSRDLSSPTVKLETFLTKIRRAGVA